MVKFAINFLKTVRPRQWLKNLSVGAALVFSGNLLVLEKLEIVIYAVGLMTLIASAIYIFNDLIDRQHDRQHPFKKLRPIAAMKISPVVAFIAFVIISLLGFLLSWTLSRFFFTAIFVYWLLQIAYTLWLKHIEIIEMLVIAGGFILRIYAGALVIDAHLSIWFLLCVVTTALLISVGKRRAELAILTEQTAASHRKVLSKYNEAVLNGYVTMFATSTWVSWSLFTFFEPPAPLAQTYPQFFSNLPLTFSGTNKWLMTTIPIVIYGIMRYLRIIYDGSKAESPERVLLSDKPLLTTVTIWGLMVIVILYLFPSYR